MSISVDNQYEKLFLRIFLTIYYLLVLIIIILNLTLGFFQLSKEYSAVIYVLSIIWFIGICLAIFATWANKISLLILVGIFLILSLILIIIRLIFILAIYSYTKTEIKTFSSPFVDQILILLISISLTTSVLLATCRLIALHKTIQSKKRVSTQTEEEYWAKMTYF
ncbi:unnamed protein product [Didymodactylos carnosus]|uniref:Uncharacterized protein n=2 Tax=Didymodactylos carnosus TaxID=1234261 RepID=A0A814GM25_9BILA|nr:unnamed protein product [Didymodactylos carnosus]CAF3769627.1 unnamed protein product [Didymodactylos carnosus]